MKQEQIVSYFFVGLFLFILYQLLLIFSPFFVAISWAAILAFAFYPLYRRILHLTRMNHFAASLTATLAVVLIVVLPAAITLVSLMKETIELYPQVNDYIVAGNLERFIAQIRQTSTAEWAQDLWRAWNPHQQEMSDFILESAKGIGSFAASQLTAFTKNLIYWVINLFFIAFLLFFFFRDGKIIYDYIFQLIPMAKKNKTVLSEKINETFSAVIRGQFVTCIIQGTVAGFTFWILGLPLPFFFGFLTFIFSMIPVTGAATVWAPFALYLFLTQQMEKAIGLTVIGIFGISLIDNLLKPILIGGKTKLPTFLMFLGILGSLKLYGLAGIFLGPVVLTLFFALAKIYREEYQPET